MSWLAALTAESDAQRQVKLIEQAAAYTQDEIYVRAIPLLEEAAGYDDKYTLEAEEALKDAYLNMLDQSGYARKYTNLLEKQMARKDAAPEIYAEAGGVLSGNREGDGGLRRAAQRHRKDRQRRADGAL